MNPNLAMFAQMAQGGQQGASGVPQGGQPPQMPQGAPQRPQNPVMAVAKPELKQAAQQGENGDDTLAHLTKGEMVVPPQVQTPKILAELKKAFQKAGANPAQYQVGNPAMQMNSQTGAPQFGFSFADILPIAGTVAGAYFGGPWGAAAGGALGGGIAGYSHGGGMGNVLGGAALGGVGGYLGGGGLQSAFPETFGAGAGGGFGTAGASGATAPGIMPGVTPAGMDSTAAGNFAAENSANPAQSATNQQMFAKMAQSQQSDSSQGATWAWLKAHPGIAAMGASAALAALTSGGNFGGSSKAQAVSQDPSFNKPMTPQSQLPDYRTVLGGGPQQTQFPSDPNAYRNYGYGPAYNFFRA